MSSKFLLGVTDDAIILNGHGSGHRDVRVALDGSVTEVKEPKSIVRYKGSWKDGTFAYEVTFERLPGSPPGGLEMIRRTFRPTVDGLLVTVSYQPSDGKEAIALYRHAEDIPMPTPAKATIADLKWLAGAWVGSRGEGGATTIEERWTPPLGGAMLGVARSVKGGKMGAFEYLRIVERDGGLVYIAQPGGAKPTEFVLSELVTEGGSMRAVFDNPRHDYPKRIVYQLSEEGVLSTTTGQVKGGMPRRSDYMREGT